jgi:hypothetical protein
MTNKKSIKFLFTLGLMVFAMVLLPGHLWARDGDGDGYDTKVEPIDCNDKDPAINPGATEICDDGIDNNCNDLTDAGDPDCAVSACTDLDGDGYNVEGNDCGPIDCDDASTSVYPGAPELCDGSIDHNCDGFTDESCTACTDGDNDTFFAEAGCDDNPIDCDDALAAVNPGASEIPDNEIDDNCDGQIDEEPCPADDSDCDGLSNLQELDGFALSSGLEWWNGSGWTNSPIPGSGCLAGEKCLNPFVGDLFVIWRPLSTGSEMNITDNIFEFAGSPISNFTVWVLNEPLGASATRQITPGSNQKAVVLIEDAGLFGATGFSQPGSIMDENKGKAWVYSHQIVADVSRCEGGCKVDGTPMGDTEVERLHFKNTAAHEIWHVLSALLTDDLHILEDRYIMYPATVFTQKGPNRTYTIGDEFSPSGMTEPQFQ